jgi:hypothetical protein
MTMSRAHTVAIAIISQEKVVDWVAKLIALAHNFVFLNLLNSLIDQRALLGVLLDGLN